MPKQIGVVAFFVIAGLTSSGSALSEGAKAPNFSVDAGDLKSFQGKVVLVDFWAHWCKPCKKELPVLQKLYDAYQAQGLVVIGVNVDKDQSKAKDFLNKLTKLSGKVTFPIVYDTEQTVAPQYDPKTMPSSYLIDRKGRVLRVFSGFRGGYREGDGKDLENAIRRALGFKDL